MDFFKSILSEDPDPPVPENPPNSDPQNPSQNDQERDIDDDSDSNPNPNPNPSDGGGWSFGGLIKTLSAKSESVLETYRRDLKEFGSGLKSETAVFREVASRAVKELPSSIEVGASAAKGSVGHAIDEVLKSTAEMISQGKETLLAPSDADSDTSESYNYSNQSLDSRRYSRFDVQLRTIQSDLNTYCEEPEDSDDYSKWKSGFVLEEKSEEVENLIEENGTMGGIYKRVVPNSVDHETFWCRYFYRVHKLQQQEDVRANLVKRAIAADEEEELSWDVDDEDEEVLEGSTLKNKELGDQDLTQIAKEESAVDDSGVGSSRVVDGNGDNKSNVVDLNEGNIVEQKSNDGSGEEVEAEETSEGNKDELASKSDEKVASEGKGDHGGESCKDSDISVVSSQPSMPEEEDIGWDEIEDLGSIDEKKENHGGSPNREILRKRLSSAEEEEDLSWDIEDDDEPVKA